MIALNLQKKKCVQLSYEPKMVSPLNYFLFRVFISIVKGQRKEGKNGENKMIKGFVYLSV